MASKVNLKKYLTIAGRWQFVPVLKVNGKPHPGAVLIAGEAKKGTSGKFYLEWRADGKRIQKPCGTSPREALDAWQTQVARLDGTLESPEQDDRPVPLELVSIKTACDTFLAEVRAGKSIETYRAYSRDAAWFRQSIRRTTVGKVTRADMIHLFGVGRDEGLNAGTINRAVMVGLMAMRNAGAVVTMKKGDWLKVTEIEVTIYEPEEIIAFFAECDADESLLFQTYLQTGFRNREVATLRWKDIDFTHGRLAVCDRPEYAFHPKSYETRRVPVPSSLITLLKFRRKRSKGALVFPTEPHPKRPNYGGEQPDAHHLELCKQIAYRARLNCGHCVTAKGRCSDGPRCAHWSLHRWRHSYATTQLRDGMDLKSLQTLLGHKHLATTEKYLLALRLDALQPQIESSRLAQYMSPSSS